MTAPKRLLSIGHSYCVRRNRELADAIARAGNGAWEVTVGAPDAFPGDLGPIVTRRDEDELSTLRVIPVRWARRIHVMTYGRGLRPLLEQDWDVIHCWEEPYVLSAAQIARRSPGRAALVYATFQNIAKRYPPPFSAIERFSMQRARGWIAFGHSVEATLEQGAGYHDRPHTVIPFGVDLGRFSPDVPSRAALLDELHWADDDTPVVGYLGRFLEAKGLPLLLHALRELRRRGVAWRALFVGGGSLEPELRAFAAEQASRTHVVTGVSHDQVPRYLRAMDVMCAPSQTTAEWREQFGRMIVEAFACGVPVIGSDSGEIPHVIGDAGLVVGERDTAGWIAALSHLLTDAADRRTLGARGRARAGAEFAWPVVANRHLAFFNHLLET